MELIREFGRLNKGDAAIAGGKGASLGEMTHAGIPVPPGFVVLTHSFERFLDESDLRQEIEAVLATVDTGTIHTVEHASEKIQGMIRAAAMPSDIATEIQSYFTSLHAEFVAVRSSATAEDGAAAAWAGQLDTYLNTTESELLTNVQRCWASLFTPRAIFYRFEKGMHNSHISVAVVVQKMVQSEVSGIAFSVHPVTEDRNQLIIEAGFGLGEAIVSGQVTPDSYVVTKSPRSIIDKNIATQTRGLFRAASQGNEWRELDATGAKQKLSDVEILKLSEAVICIENHYALPCDIEWAFEAGAFYITQSRPITTLSGSPVSKSDANSSMHVSNFTMTWEGHGITFTFEYSLGKVYFPPESFTVVRGGVVQEYISKRRIAIMDADGLHRTPEEVEQKIAEMKRAVEEGQRDAIELLSQPLTRESVERLFKICERVMRLYYYFDSLFWDSAFEKGKTDARVRKAVEFQQSYKNVGRDAFNAFYFGNGTLPRMLRKLEAQLNLPSGELDSYTEEQLYDLFNGVRVDPLELDRRKAAYAMIKDESGVMRLYTGDEGLRKIDAFLAGETSRQTTEFRGRTAHATGKVVRGRVCNISRDYTDLEKMIRQMDAMKAGDILVTQTTDPEMMPALQKAAAAVTDIGGMLSHTAIVARELNIPCIVDTKNASKVLKTGDVIDVDTDTGVVRLVTTIGASIASHFTPEKYRFVGLYKCQPFAFWFWAAWYSKEKLDAIGLTVDRAGYLGVKGGNNLIETAVADQFKRGLLEKVDASDLAYFDRLQALATKTFEESVAWARTVTSSSDPVTAFPILVERARDIMFFWFIGWLSSQSIDERLQNAAQDSGIAPDAISKYVEQPDTPLIRQQAEARRLKNIIIEKGYWDALKENPDAAIRALLEDRDVGSLVKDHVKAHEWLPIINFIGERFTVEKLLEQMSFFNHDVDSSKDVSPAAFEPYAHIAARIAYLNQASAEYFSIFTLAVMPFLDTIAGKIGVSYRELLDLTPDEIAASLRGDFEAKHAIRVRSHDNWVIYADDENLIRILDDRGTVEAIAACVLPKPESVDASEIRGVTGNKGTATGTVRIIIATDDFGKMKDGDVLVTPMTTPDFVLLMQKSSAIVTDMGGMLCHAAIVSREMGKPCVIDTKFATKILKDGDRVEVDATSGVVRVLERAKPVVLSKIFSRERPFFYFRMWNDSDRLGFKRFVGHDVANNLFWREGSNNKGSVWYDGEEFAVILEKISERYTLNPNFLDELFGVLDAEWLHIGPLLTGERTLQTIDDFADYYEHLTQWWTAMDIVYHTSGIESVDAAIRARALAKREVTEKYSDMMHTIYLDFWSRVFPQYADITYVLLPDETVRLGRGEMSEAEITSIRGRLSGFALLNERVYTNEEMFRQLSARHITLASEDVSGLTELKGSTAYPGVVRGKVRLLRFRELIQTLEAGEILVTEMTDPDFVPAIKKAAAVVTDEGGVMCHAAIVSRELQKPCIVGTKLATKYLKDGDMVEVDATNGIVRKI